MIMQIMPEVFILGSIYEIPGFWDFDEGRRLETYPYILGSA